MIETDAACSAAQLDRGRLTDVTSYVNNRRFLSSDSLDLSRYFFNFRMENVNSRLVLLAILDKLEDSDVFITSGMVLMVLVTGALWNMCTELS